MREYEPSTTSVSQVALDARGGQMPVKEASSEETPYGRYITSDGWFVLNL